jgi:hypothetical protein
MCRKHLFPALLIGLITLLFISCEKEDASENAARLRIKLTDAAAPVLKEMHIEIVTIEVQTTDSAGNAGEWVTLSYAGGAYNLLKLMNGKMVQLVDQYFPAGEKIDKIRLTLGNNNRMVTVTDQQIPLQKSPDIMDQLVINEVNAVLTANVIISIVIDINAALSVYEMNGNWYINPRARAFPETYGGSLRGYVAPLEASPVVMITREGDSLFSLPEGSEGMFFFSGLQEGARKVHLLASPESGYRDTIFFSDSIRQGRITDITPKPIRLQLQ